MPRFNRLGDVIAGVGDGVVSVNRQRIARGGAAAPLSDTEVIYQTAPIGTENWRVEACEFATGQKRQVDPGGAARIAAGGGRWALWGGASKGLRTSWGARWPNAGHPDMALDGSLAFVTDYQSGRGVTIVDPSGAVTDLITAESVSGLRAIQNGGASWIQGGRVSSFPAMLIQTVSGESVYQPQLFEVAGRVWIQYHTADRLLLHPANDAREGYVVEDSPTTYAPDAIAWVKTFAGPYGLVVNLVRFVWASREGEAPSDIVERTVDLREPMVQLARIPAPVVAPFSASKWFGYFYAFGKYRDNPSAPANWTLIDEPGVAARVPRSLAIVASTAVVPEVAPDRLAAVWVDAREYDAEGKASPQSVERLERNITAARKALIALGRVRPVIGYWDGRDVPASSCDWIGLQCYQGRNERFETFRDWVKATLATVMILKPVVLVWQAYDRDDDAFRLQPRRLELLQELLPDVMRSPRVVGPLLFSDGRKGGTRDYDTVMRSWHVATFRAIPRAPEIQGGQPMPEGKPSIKVDDWSRTVALGGRGRVLFTLSGPTPIKYVTVDLLGDVAEGQTEEVSDGRRLAGLYFTPTKRGRYSLQVRVLDVDGRADQTGATRIVEVV